MHLKPLANYTPLLKLESFKYQGPATATVKSLFMLKAPACCAFSGSMSWSLGGIGMWWYVLRCVMVCPGSSRWEAHPANREALQPMVLVSFQLWLRRLDLLSKAEQILRASPRCTWTEDRWRSMKIDEDQQSNRKQMFINSTVLKLTSNASRAPNLVRKPLYFRMCWWTNLAFFRCNWFHRFLHDLFVQIRLRRQLMFLEWPKCGMSFKVQCGMSLQ